MPRRQPQLHANFPHSRSWIVEVALDRLVNDLAFCVFHVNQLCGPASVNRGLPASLHKARKY
jgi:hypothetical protein